MQALLKVLFFVSLLLVGGCSSLQSSKRVKQFTLDRSWARSTTQKIYVEAQVNHIMPPILFENMVIQGNEIDGIVAYNKHLGYKKWNRLINGGVTSEAKLVDGVLYFGAGDGFFYALDAKTGKTKWSSAIQSEGIGAPLVSEGVIYFLVGNGTVYALKVGSGEKLWTYSRVDVANLTVRGASEPSLRDQQLYVGFSDGYLASLDKSKGTLIWERKLGESPRFRDVDSKPVVDGDRLYVSSYDGQLYCLNATNGQTIWQNDDGGFTPVTVFNNTLYYSSSTGKVIAIEKSSGRILWSHKLAQTIAGQPIVYRGLVIVGEWSGALRALDQSTGKSVTHFKTGKGVTSRPTIDEEKNRIYVMSSDANLFAINLKLVDPIGAWTWEK